MGKRRGDWSRVSMGLPIERKREESETEDQTGQECLLRTHCWQGQKELIENVFGSGQDWSKMSMGLQWEREEGIGQECLLGAHC